MFRRDRALARRLFATALALLGAPVLARAALPDAPDLATLQQQGYVLLDRINTPLLAVGDRASQADVARDVLYFGRADLPQVEQRDAANLASRNEFARHDALQQLQPELLQRAQRVAAANGFLIPAHASLGPYDFKRQRFPLELGLNLQPRHGDRSYFCAGAYGLERNVRLVNCVEPSNWNRGSLAFEYAVMDSESVAEQFKRDLASNAFVFVFVAVRDGALSGAPRPPLSYGIYPRNVVRSVQPMRILGLLVLDHQGRVLTRIAMPGS